MDIYDGSGEGNISDELKRLLKDSTEEFVRRWHSQSDQLLLERGDEIDYSVFPLVQGSVPPRWENQHGAWVFYYPHMAAPYLHEGTDPHPIEPRDPEGWLAFEWPEMENEIFGNTGKTFSEVFEDTWPTVFFKEVMHPGNEALRFVSDSIHRVDTDD